MRTTVFVILGVVAGCASQPTPLQSAAQSAAGQSSYLQAAAGTGSVSIKRDSADTVAACSLVVLVDDVPAADLGLSERVVLHLPAGDHVLSVKERASAECRGVNVPKARTQIASGGFAGYQVGMANGGMAITPTPF